jgi:hypothetical protein
MVMVMVMAIRRWHSSIVTTNNIATRQSHAQMVRRCEIVSTAEYYFCGTAVSLQLGKWDCIDIHTSLIYIRHVRDHDTEKLSYESIRSFILLSYVVRIVIR